MTVLVAGGTGRLGTIVTNALTARGERVRVLSRNRNRAAHLAVEVVEGDVRDEGSLVSAMDGVRTVVSAVHGFMGPGRVTPQAVDVAGNQNLIRAAEAHGADFVLVSVVGAAPDHPMDLFRCKYEAETLLQASTVPWTVVRATAFLETWAEMCSKGIVFGRGNNPINFVAITDVACVVERAVIDPSLRGRVLEVGGPENMTFNQLTTLVREVGSVDKHAHHVPRWLLQAAAPLHRVPRAALAMDTLDMTFEMPMDSTLPTPTQAREALTDGR